MQKYLRLTNCLTQEFDRVYFTQVLGSYRIHVLGVSKNILFAKRMSEIGKIRQVQD